MIRALVLDFGNVISEPQDISCYERMSALSGLPADFFRNAFWKYREPFDRGTIRGQEMYKQVLEDAGLRLQDEKLNDLIEQLLAEDLGSWFHVSDDVTNWALKLQKEGYILGILSNMPYDFLERFGDRVQLFQKADVAIFSCQIHLVKPEPEIYKVLFDRTGCVPEEIVFFDDIAQNVAAAAKIGIHAFVWSGLDDAKKRFTQLSQHNV